MINITYEASEKYPVVILLKEQSLNKSEINTHYIKPLVALGIPIGDIVVISLDYNGLGKAPAKLIKTCLDELIPVLNDIGAKYLLCADAPYFKAITKNKTADAHLGYILDFEYSDEFNGKVIFSVNHKSLFYNPTLVTKLNSSLDTLARAVKGQDSKFSGEILEQAYYPKTVDQIAAALESLHQYDELSCDIEAASLRHSEAGIASIGFAWSETEGTSFLVDYKSLLAPVDGVYGKMVHNPQVKALLKKFFIEYKGNLIFHGASYDTKVLIYELWMSDHFDNENLVKGLHTLYERLDDTKLMAFLCLNTTAEISLSLKDLAQEFLGNWAQENIKNVLKISADKLLKYNLIDCAATVYCAKKYRPLLIQDQQNDLYKSMYVPSQKVVTQMELTGFPMSPEEIQKTKVKLTKIAEDNYKIIQTSSHVSTALHSLALAAHTKDYERRKDAAKNPERIKIKEVSVFLEEEINPNSPPQLQVLLYSVMGLPIIDLTKTRQPATGSKTLLKLANHTDDEGILKTLTAVITYGEAAKILSTFITAFENGIDKGDGYIWLHGSLNVAGPVSGRMSSSDPNLQNLPATSTHAKIVKECFRAPPGFLIAGADYNSLEDYISALTTKDPNKLKIYLEGYDGHSFRAYNYWPELFPDIQLNPISINSIAKKYPHLRQRSKAPTFALTYKGTHHTLMKNLGFPLEEALKIEDNYHLMYVVSDQWVEAKLDQASIDGYVTLAFGLRLRTPLLHQTIRNTRSTPNAAKEEERTAANALGQSYGLLTNRAYVEFMNRVWASEYRYAIRPIMPIHDAIYFIFPNNAEIVKWFNDNLVECMQWQDLPELRHDKVKLGAEIGIFYPSWNQEMVIPNGASLDHIKKLAVAHQERLSGSS